MELLVLSDIPFVFLMVFWLLHLIPWGESQDQQSAKQENSCLNFDSLQLQF